MSNSTQKKRKKTKCLQFQVTLGHQLSTLNMGTETQTATPNNIFKIQMIFFPRTFLIPWSGKKKRSRQSYTINTQTHLNCNVVTIIMDKEGEHGAGVKRRLKFRYIYTHIKRCEAALIYDNIKSLRVQRASWSRNPPPLSD